MVRCPGVLTVIRDLGVLAVIGAMGVLAVIRCLGVVVLVRYPRALAMVRVGVLALTGGIAGLALLPAHAGALARVSAVLTFVA
jgi:hypothetical protein